MLTKDEIDALEQLLEQATPGPLFSHDGACCKQIYEADGYCVATTLSTKDEIYTCGEGRSEHGAQELKALIVAAVNALPTLLALSRAALEVEGELRSLAADFDEENKEGPMGLPADFLRAQADKITAAAGGAK